MRSFDRRFVSALAAVLGIVALPASTFAATTVIHAGHLIAEPGKPEALKQSIVIEGGKIVAVKNGFVPGDTVINLEDSWVMPGLMDMHTHVTGVLDLAKPAAGQIALAYMRPPAEQVLQMLPGVKTLLMNGFTTIRCLGDQSSTNYFLRDAINAGTVPGPRMFVAEAQIAVDGGDMDPSRWDVRQELEPFVTSRGRCTGVVECTKAVRLEVQRGADVVKLRQSGMALNPNIPMVESEEELKAIIDTAHKLDRKVAAHVDGTPAYLHMVIAAGADTIEHGPLDDEAIALMKKHGTANTPTLLAGKMIDYRFEEGSAGVGKAYRAGIPIIFGSDLGIMGPDQVHEEFGLLAAAGLPPAQVLRAATVNAANALGHLGEGLGSIAPGKIADVIAMKIDPITHIDQVAAPGKVSFVMKEGQVYKDER